VGCGTGIFTRQLAARGLAVMGLEPNAAMRAQAQVVPPPTHALPPRYVAGTAEATGMPAAAFEAVTVAQAFHWCDPDPSVREFGRVLVPGGWVVLLWNVRDDADPFSNAYGRLLGEFATEPALVGADKYVSCGESFLVRKDVRRGESRSFAHGQVLDEEGLLGRARSVSFVPNEPGTLMRFEAGLRDLFARHEVGGRVEMCYRTVVYRACPAGGRITGPFRGA
jgi:SAM-dependent methyltransferase